MSCFRPSLAAADSRRISAEVVREICAEVTRPANFFVAQPVRLTPYYEPNEETFWEVIRGRVLDGTQTRQRRRFETWGVYRADDRGERPAEPLLAVRFDVGAGLLYVTRAILCHAHETYDAGVSIILTREVLKWQRELVGTIVLDRLADVGALRDELACLFFQAVVGTSRLPLTSVESPLPAFALGQFGYCFRPGAEGVGPVTCWPDLLRLPGDVDLADAERVKHLEFLLRAVPADEVDALAGPYSAASAQNAMVVLRAVFNGVTLSPYSDFVAKSLAFVRHLTDRAVISDGERVDFLCHILRQISRHLSAYDLVTFHHRGANYPDALLLDELLADLLPLAARQPALFAGDGRVSRLRRRAIRHGFLLKLEFAGQPVPDVPTSPGENLRVLPPPFDHVPDDQIYSPVTRRRKIFEGAPRPEPALISACLKDLSQPEELQELGTALFLDRPLGFGKAAGEPDQTLLASHVLFSRSLAERRLDLLVRRPEWLPDAGAIERWRDELRTLVVNGLPLANPGPPSRPGVVSLHDALRVADDWQFLRTTRQTLHDFQVQYDLRSLDGLDVTDWRLLVPGGTEAEPTLCVFDQNLQLRLELAADLSRGYASRGGSEFPAAGLRRVGPTDSP
jgi:hypothetical protein